MRGTVCRPRSAQARNRGVGWPWQREEARSLSPDMPDAPVLWGRERFDAVLAEHGLVQVKAS